MSHDNNINTNACDHEQNQCRRLWILFIPREIVRVLWLTMTIDGFLHDRTTNSFDHYFPSTFFASYFFFSCVFSVSEKLEHFLKLFFLSSPTLNFLIIGNVHWVTHQTMISIIHVIHCSANTHNVSRMRAPNQSSWSSTLSTVPIIIVDSIWLIISWNGHSIIPIKSIRISITNVNNIQIRSNRWDDSFSYVVFYFSKILSGCPIIRCHVCVILIV